MDESEFLSVLDLFPTVRSASFCLEDDDEENEEEEESDHESESERHGSATREQNSMPSSSSLSYFENAVEWLHEPQVKPRASEGEDVFWIRLKESVEQKLSPTDSTRFCDAFRKAHQSLVHEVLSLEAVDKILKTWKLNHE